MGDEPTINEKLDYLASAIGVMCVVQARLFAAFDPGGAALLIRAYADCVAATHGKEEGIKAYDAIVKQMTGVDMDTMRDLRGQGLTTEQAYDLVKKGIDDGN